MPTVKELQKLAKERDKKLLKDAKSRIVRGFENCM